MYAFKIVTTVFLGLMIAICAYVVAKRENKTDVYVGTGITVIHIMAIAAIWL